MIIMPATFLIEQSLYAGIIKQLTHFISFHLTLTKHYKLDVALLLTDEETVSERLYFPSKTEKLARRKGRIRTQIVSLQNHYRIRGKKFACYE